MLYRVSFQRGDAYDVEASAPYEAYTKCVRLHPETSGYDLGSVERLKSRQLIYNAIRTPDGTVLESRYRHDYKSHVDLNEDLYMVDGGLAYLRRNVNKIPAEELSLYTDSPHSQIREVFAWGTRGIDGSLPLRWVLLKDMSKDHIEAIIDTQTHIPEYMREIFIKEIMFRLGG